jgi:hypothetical protein
MWSQTKISDQPLLLGKPGSFTSGFLVKNSSLEEQSVLASYWAS